MRTQGHHQALWDSRYRRQSDGRQTDSESPTTQLCICKAQMVSVAIDDDVAIGTDCRRTPQCEVYANYITTHEYPTTSLSAASCVVEAAKAVACWGTAMCKTGLA